MNLLILGGTVFLGRALVVAARDRGHNLTLFNRGRSNPDLFPEVEQVHGDRDGGIGALNGRSWDAVVDLSGYVPRIVRQSAEQFSEKAGHYTFISTISVYQEFSQVGIDENSPLGTLADETIEEVNGETYGPLKALCEKVVQSSFTGRTLVVRPGLIVGPFDPTDRFTYWPHRVAQGEEVLAPGRPERKIQFIDVRDLAEWILRMAEANETGVYNADSPSNLMMMGELLETCRSVSGSNADITWIRDEFLLEHQVEPWSDLPLWLPENNPDYAGFMAVDVSKALQKGLIFRPLAETVRATLAWDQARPTEHTLRAGLSREREIELLQAWHGDQKGG